jgi:hypothetical protein
MSYNPKASNDLDKWTLNAKISPTLCKAPSHHHRGTPNPAKTPSSQKCLTTVGSFSLNPNFFSPQWAEWIHVSQIEIAAQILHFEFIAAQFLLLSEHFRILRELSSSFAKARLLMWSQ